MKFESRITTAAFQGIVALCAACASITALSACGGGSSSSSAPISRSTGKLSVSVQWPAPGRLVPSAANSIVAVLKDSSGTLISQQTITRPTAPPWTSTATFPNITAASVVLFANAYPNVDGTGIAQATGSVPAAITPGQSTAVTLTMASTIDHLTMTPVSPVAPVGILTQLTATAYNLTGSVVLTTPGKIHWVSNHPEYATVDGNGLVTGVAQGSPLITATETESQLSVSKSLNVTPYTAIHGPAKSVMSADGKYLFVTREVSRDVSVFTVGSGGALTSLATTSLSGKYPFGMWITHGASGSYLYVLAADSAQQSAVSNTVIFQYTIQSNGTLAAMSPASVSAGSTPHGLVGDSGGKYLYDLDEAIGIRSYTIGASGALTVNGPDVATPSFHPNGPAAITADAKTLYISDYEGVIIIETIQSDGTLVNKNASGAFIGNDITLDPVAPYLYLATDGAVVPYSIQANSGLLPDGAYTGFAGNARSSAISSDGKYLYVIGDSSPDNGVNQYGIASDGTLSTLSPAVVVAGVNPGSITLAPNGLYVYVTNHDSDTISQYLVGTGGLLTPMSPATVPD